MPARTKQRLAMLFCTGVCAAGIVALIMSRPGDAAWPDVETLLAEHCVPFALEDAAVNAAALDVKITSSDDVWFYDRRTGLSLVVDEQSCLVSDVRALLNADAQHLAVERAIEFGLGVMPGSDVEDLAAASGWDVKILVGTAAAPRAHPSLLIYQVDAQAADDAGRATIFRFDRAEEGGFDA